MLNSMFDRRKTPLYLSAVFICVVTVWYLLSHIISTTRTNMPGPPQLHFHYSTVPGLFLQDDPATTPQDFDYNTTNFGLINRTYPTDLPDPDRATQWRRFATYLRHLVSEAPADTSYKLLYLARHGQGYHNVAESFYGTEAWDAYWSKLEGNGTTQWADARLTEVGETQAREARGWLGKQFGADVGMMMPEAWVVSPLMRCLTTCNLTWAQVKLEGGGVEGFRPVVKEALREVMGVHTCDRRSARSIIQAAVPEWEIEQGFTEMDELWQAEHRETAAERDVRARALLDDVFAQYEDTVVMSFTAHSGIIGSLLRVVGHREFALGTGGMMPVLVKATRIS